MFEQATLEAAPASHRLFGTFAGVTCQAVVVGLMILGPLVFPQVLPDVHSLVMLVAPGAPPPPPAPGPLVRPRAVASTARTFCALCMPVAIPKHTIQIVDELPEAVDAGIGVPGGIPGGIPGGSPDGVLGGLLRTVPSFVPPKPIETPRPAPSATPAAIPRVRIGGLVKLATPIHRVEPQYPLLAKQARISGVVELEGVIGVDGRLHELKVKSGHPLLIKAALDAVSQWIYEPTTLNSQPVEVVTPITVTFRLN